MLARTSIAIFIVTVVVAASAHAAGDPAALCAGAKRAAAGKKAAAKLKCWAIAAKKGLPMADSACLGKAEAKFDAVHHV